MRKFLYWRPFGVELEINSFDGISTFEGELPKGMPYVANLVSKTLEEYVELRDFGHTHWQSGNGYWVLKPDNSCGMEVCSPIMQGWNGLKRVCRVVEAFEYDKLIKVDYRCSFHVHLDVGDLNMGQIARILNWWIKCEPVFMDSVSLSRKDNRYCQYIGLWDWVEERCFSPSEIIKILGESKYHSINTYHLFSGERTSIEFRIGEGKLCKDAFGAKNWIRLLIHFLEVAKEKSPKNLYWLDVDEVFEFLGFNDELSEGMKQIRNWFISRLASNTFGDTRMVTQKGIKAMFEDSDGSGGLDRQNSLYNKIYST